MPNQCMWWAGSILHTVFHEVQSREEKPITQYLTQTDGQKVKARLLTTLSKHCTADIQREGNSHKHEGL